MFCNDVSKKSDFLDSIPRNSQNVKAYNEIRLRINLGVAFGIRTKLQQMSMIPKEELP
jgi:hypothetical protein